MAEVLARWEKWNSQVKTFECRFTCWTYDGVFGTPDRPKFTNIGSIKYVVPDRLSVEIYATLINGKELPIAPARAEHWEFNGKSLFEFSAARREVIELGIPVEWQKAAIISGVLGCERPKEVPRWRCLFSRLTPYPFGVTADDLKRRYHIREISRPDHRDEIFLELWPRLHSANCCQKVGVILAARDASPSAIKITWPNGKDSVAFRFYDVVVNKPTAGDRKESSQPTVPEGWRMVKDSPVP